MFSILCCTVRCVSWLMVLSCCDELCSCSFILVFWLFWRGNFNYFYCIRTATLFSKLIPAYSPYSCRRRKQIGNFNRQLCAYSPKYYGTYTRRLLKFSRAKINLFSTDVHTWWRSQSDKFTLWGVHRLPFIHCSLSVDAFCLSPRCVVFVVYFSIDVSCLQHLLYIQRNTELRYLIDSRWSDRRETLHVNRVRHEHENSHGPMSIALC